MFALQNAANAYKDVKNVSGIEDADPHKLVDMLYSAAIEKIANAKGLMQAQAIREKGLSISHAIAIVEELRGSLDMERGGEISTNLSDLYEYMKELLLKANLNNDEAALDECSQLISTLQDGWRQIPVDVRKQHQPHV